MKTKPCQYCKREYPLKDFKIKTSNSYSSHCTTCRGLFEAKDKEDEQSVRELSDKEIKLQKRFIKSLKAKERKEKLNITKGKI